MGHYLDSNLIVLEMYFFNQNRQASGAHISRKKGGVLAPDLLPGMVPEARINLKERGKKPGVVDNYISLLQ